MRSLCNGSVLRTATVATTLAIVLLMVSPTTATPNPPVKLGNEVHVSTYASSTQYYPCGARRPDGKWVVVWASSGQDGSSYGVYMQLYTTGRTPYGGEERVNTNTNSNQNNPRVAVAADNSFVVVWHSNPGGSYRIQAQLFDSNGAKVGGEFYVSGGTHPDVKFLTNGDVVFTWRDLSYRAMMRRYSPTLVPLANPVTVHSSSAQHWPAIAALSGGGFVIVYHGAHTGGSSNDVVAQIFDTDGTKVGTAFRVNTFTSNNQQQPHVAALPDGGFIVAWESYNQYGTNYGIVGRHFAADGTPVSAEFQVNSYTTGAQYGAEVATFKDNSFAVVWFGPWQNSYDVAVQYFDAAHNKVGSQILVHTHTASSQYLPSIASNWEDGEFGVFYSSLSLQTSSSSYDIGGQWFVADITTSQVAPACTSACLQYFCTEGKILDVKVTGVVSNDVFGSVYFSDDSNLAAAAVFAGLVAEGETATVTVKCSGPQSSFASASANGVTTQAFASPWPSSFTFDLGGATQSPPAPSPERCYHEPCAHGKCNVQGTSFDIIVEGIASNNVWGTEEFSDDSWVGSAAVHQGLLEAGSVGSVTVTCAGARSSLTGSSRNGVASNSFGPWQFTYIVSTGPTAAPALTNNVCVGPCIEHNCPEDRVHFLRVYGTTNGYIWGGNAPYTADSTVSSAAVHAGLVTAGATAIVKATCKGAQSAFTGSSQNGVTTSSFGPWPSSFELSAGTGMPTVACGAGVQCLKDECAVAGRVIKVSVTGSTNSATQFWGTTLYADDSPLSHAAVHAGLIQADQTAVLYATCQGPHDAFTGTTANGVTSSAWNSPWPGSFTLSATL